MDSATTHFIMAAGTVVVLSFFSTEAAFWVAIVLAVLFLLAGLRRNGLTLGPAAAHTVTV